MMEWRESSIQHEGETRSFTTTQPGEVGPARPELAVAGVAQAGHDVALLVQRAVEGGAVDVDVGMGRRRRPHALGRGDQVDQLDPDRRPTA